jgi:phosphohistidine phosphatase
MKTLYLVRHASAVERESSMKDIDRELSAKGQEESKIMAQLFKERAITPELWISSHARRALETAYIFAEILDYPRQNIVVDKKIYDESSGSRFIHLLHTLEEKLPSSIIFGHEPTLSEFASFLIKKYHAGIPKTGILGIAFPQKKWLQIEAGSGLLKMVLFPHSEKYAREILKKSLKSALYDKNLELLQLLDEKTTKNMQDIITKYSGKMTKKFFKRLEGKDQK